MPPSSFTSCLNLLRRVPLISRDAALELFEAFKNPVEGIVRTSLMILGIWSYHSKMFGFKKVRSEHEIALYVFRQSFRLAR